MDKVLIRWNQNFSHSAALSRLSNDICSDRCNSEWGILLHGDGIWLLNRDIPIGKSSFGSKRTVFKLSFIRKTDIEYLEFFKTDYLLGYNNAVYFFRDIIIYKNTFFHLQNAIAGMFTGVVIRDFLHIIHYNIKEKSSN